MSTSTLGLSAGRPSENRKAEAMKAVASDKVMVRVNFDLEESEYLKLKVHAANSRRTIAEIMRDLIGKGIV